MWDKIKKFFGRKEPTKTSTSAEWPFPLDKRPSFSDTVKEEIKPKPVTKPKASKPAVKPGTKRKNGSNA